jgi:hypothetical protein
MNSQELFKLLSSVRMVQRKLELLKPIIDKACDDVETASCAAERAEGTPIKPPSEMTDDELAFAFQCGGPRWAAVEIFARWKDLNERIDVLLTRLREAEGTPL